MVIRIIHDGMGINDEGEPIPMELLTPEDRCACKEEMTQRLLSLGLTQLEINLFFIHTQTLNAKEIDDDSP
jgi:hypothetical protein